MFSLDKTQVLLIEKKKPEWQKGLMNGIGGKIESIDDSPVHAMVREFFEETGISTSVYQWTQKCLLQSSFGLVYVYCCFSDDIVFAETKEAEVIHTINCKELGSSKLLPSCQWMIPMMLDEGIIMGSVMHEQ